MLIMLVTAAAVFLAGCSSVSHELPEKQNLSAAERPTETSAPQAVSESVSSEETTTAIPVPEFATVSVAAVGDNLIHSSL